MKAVLNFTPAGNVEGLYTEVIPLAELGALHIERWTVIEFNNGTERWEVKRVTETGAVDPTVLFSHASRETCLRWEHGMFAESEGESGAAANHPSTLTGPVTSPVINNRHQESNEETI
jgi:hypothetical protein